MKGGAITCFVMLLSVTSGCKTDTCKKVDKEVRCVHTVTMASDKERLEPSSKRISVRNRIFYSGEENVTVLHAVRWDLNLPSGATALIRFNKEMRTPCLDVNGVERWDFQNREVCFLRTGCIATEHAPAFVESGANNNFRCAYVYQVQVTKDGKTEDIDPEVVLDDGVSDPPSELLRNFRMSFR